MSLGSILRQAGWKQIADAAFWVHARHGNISFSTDTAIENEVDRLRAQVARLESNAEELKHHREENE